MIEKQQQIGGRHIASLTRSGNIILNKEELREMGVFTFEVAFLDQEDRKVYAYSQEHLLDSYILVIPLEFYEGSEESRAFVDLICLCSETLTIPAKGAFLEEVEQLLETFHLGWRTKIGNSVIKMYMERNCWNSYLDFSVFQEMQLRGDSYRDLIASKKENAFNYCLNFFGDEMLPMIYQSQDEEIEKALQSCIAKIHQIYLSLSCHQRFNSIYNRMEQKNYTLKLLLKEIEEMAVSRKITTIAEEECEELVNNELSKIVTKELLQAESKLLKMGKEEQQVYLVKIMMNLLQKFEELNFDVGQQKYLFLHSQIIQKVFDMHHKESRRKDEENHKLLRKVQSQQNEIIRLKKQLASFEKSAEERKRQAQRKAEREEIIVKIKTESQQSHSLPEYISSQPLKAINGNTLVSKLHKTGLHKVKDKIKDGFKHQQGLKTTLSQQIRKV